MQVQHIACRSRVRISYNIEITLWFKQRDKKLWAYIWGQANNGWPDLLKSEYWKLCAKNA